MKYILETERLFLRCLTQEDYGDLAEILQDGITMTAYEHAFSDMEVQAWLGNQLRRYREENGRGLWAVIRKADGEFLGQCGLTYQDTGRSEKEVEVGYLFKRKYWHNGYATEAARGCMKYAFEKLRLDTVVSIIRDTNFASVRVAERNGMMPCGRVVKHYYNMDMPHIVYRMNRAEWAHQLTGHFSEDL